VRLRWWRIKCSDAARCCGRPRPGNTHYW